MVRCRDCDELYNYDGLELLKLRQEEVPEDRPQIVREVIKETQVLREIVKLRCRHCGALFVEKLGKCPNCGAPA
jgi:rubrerythrin